MISRAFVFALAALMMTGSTFAEEKTSNLLKLEPPVKKAEPKKPYSPTDIASYRNGALSGAMDGRIAQRIVSCKLKDPEFLAYHKKMVTLLDAINDSSPPSAFDFAAGYISSYNLAADELTKKIDPCSDAPDA